MGRLPCCSKEEMNKGAWTAQEDKILTDYVAIHGERKWSNIAKKAGMRKTHHETEMPSWGFWFITQWQSYYPNVFVWESIYMKCAW